MSESFLWVERYRPHKVSEIILPENLKATFQQFIKNREVPNLMLAGGPGVGKTSVAKAMLDELDCDYIVINGSLEGREISILRNEILQYASSTSLTSANRKYVILDEADYLTPNFVQPALRNFMVEYSDNCGFILTCNYKSKIIEPLHSRCSVIDFVITSKDKPKLATQFFRKIVAILKAEKIEYDKAVIAQLINKFFPDFRRTINELQRYAVTGKIDTGIFINLVESNLRTLIKLMKAKDYTSMRKWVAENADMDSSDLYRALYDGCSIYIKPQSIPDLILILAKYSYQDAFALDKQINTSACLLEIAAGCGFRE